MGMDGCSFLSGAVMGQCSHIQSILSLPGLSCQQALTVLQLQVIHAHTGSGVPLSHPAANSDPPLPHCPTMRNPSANE